MSPVLQPPWPLQLFNPLQSCLLAAVSEALVPALLLELQPVMPMVPAANPAIAAETINVLVVRVMFIGLLPYINGFLLFLMGGAQGPLVYLS
jgi:hypothetical protein